MAEKKSKSLRTNTPSEENPRQKVVKWLEEIQTKNLDLNAVLEEFQTFIFRVFREKEQQTLLGYFEKSFELLTEHFLRDLTTEQQVQLELWKGHTYEKQGGWTQSREAFQRAVALSEQVGMDSAKAEALRWIGHIHMMQNDFKNAFQAYRQSLQAARQANDRHAEANACSGLAYYHFEQGDLAAAKSNWQEALETAETLSDARLMAQINNNLGAVANIQGHWEEALARYGESAPEFEKMGDSRGLAETYHNMAMTYADAGRWPEAGEHYEKSYQLAQTIGDIRLQATVKLNRVELYLEIGDLQMAEAMCLQSLRTYTNVSDRLGEADAYKLLGVVYSRNQKWAVAKSYFESSLKLTRKYKNPLCEAETSFEYGKMLYEKGNLKSARNYFERALQLFSKVNASKEIRKVKKQLARFSS